MLALGEVDGSDAQRASDAVVDQVDSLSLRHEAQIDCGVRELSLLAPRTQSLLDVREEETVLWRGGLLVLLSRRLEQAYGHVRRFDGTERAAGERRDCEQVAFGRHIG